MEENIKFFLIQATNTKVQKIHAYINYYRGLNVNTSFGFGNNAHVPWITFTGEDQTTREGIYPVLLYYKKIKLLILSYGISVTKKPLINWDLESPVTIEDYLKSINLNPKTKELNNYLNSYVYKAYKISDDIDNILPEIVSDLNTLIDFYEDFLTTKGLSKTVDFIPSRMRKEKRSEFEFDLLQEEVKEQVGITEKVDSNNAPNHYNKNTMNTVFNVVKDAILKTKLIYSDILIKRLFYSLMTKPFVILSGLSGSGKTQLAISFAKALSENPSDQVCVVPVGADWTNREPLLGYPNSLVHNEYCRPENKALDLLINANKLENQKKPYFLILDEMNLSYVERYFADFLSAMESHMEIHLWNGKDSQNTPQFVTLSKNVFIIGTINVDETTYMFSPKVLDRANVIEFRVEDDELKKFLSVNPTVDVELANGEAKKVAEDFINSISIKITNNSIHIEDVLLKFFRELKKVNAEFGYRTASEIYRFLGLATNDGSMTLDEAVDSAIIQKLLPKLHGSRKKIVPILEHLWLLCEPGISLDKLDPLEVPAATKYKLSADKILRMYKSALDNGFTSFAEA